ncbi:MAG: hypoxanthine phosphoribosyltransferase [Eubacterium sp.]|nr:hypoxanthine phosphoribosyltransferase [Eubacterium sp.]
MGETIREMYTEEQVTSKIAELAAQINEDMKGEPVTIICILKGASFFACDLAKRLTMPVVMDFMMVSSYGDGTVSSGNLRVKKDLEESIEGKNVIVVEDIVDSGRTLKYLKQDLKDRGAKSVKLCALLSKPARHEVEVDVEYIGFVIPDEFVVGYGLDYAQKYRNLPYIGVVEFD